MGETTIPAEALGAPLRLAYDAAGSVKFSKTGRPVFKVAPELQAHIRMVRENFQAGLLAYAQAVINERAEDYRAQVEAAREAGRPILEKDKAALDAAVSKAVEQALAKAEAEAKPKAKARAAA